MFVSSNQWRYWRVHANRDDEWETDIIISKRNFGEDLPTSAQRKQLSPKKERKTQRLYK
jgi:hypothetical protein